MTPTVNSPPAPTANKDESQHLRMEGEASSTPHGRQDPRLTFATAAFAFRNALDNSRRNKPMKSTVSEQEVKETPKRSNTVDPTLEKEKQHLARHKGRTRIARTIQHLLSSVLSLIILILQVKLCSKNMNSKPNGKEPPKTLNELLPAIMLLATAVFAIIFDICALIAYFWPQTNFGKRAFALALQAHYIITTFKSVAYAYSTIACTGSTVGGIEMDISMYLSTANIAIEVIGLVIDQYVKRDAEKFKSISSTNAASGETDSAAAPLMAGNSSDEQSQLPAYSLRQHSYQKISDADFDQLDDLGSKLNTDLEKLKPKSSAPST